MRAALLSIHGLASHSGWIESLAVRLSAHGILVHACDLRGHGHTGRVAGQLPGPNRLLTDLELAFDALSSAAPDVPRFILGTSLGGCLAISLAARRADTAGMILISPALSPSYLSKSESARIACNLLLGGSRTVPTPRARGLEISGSKEVRDRLDADPLSLSALPARSHWSALLVIQRAKRDLGGVTVPVLCLQGAKDPVVSAQFNRRHLEGRRNTRFVWLDEAYHDLALEPDVGGIDGIITEWIDEQRAKG
jgi:alpha-beta hydrolase superfamily lysophospholipase